MKSSTWAKLFGWGQFALQTLTQAGAAFSSQGLPHGAFNWIGFGASLLTAVAVHGASNTDGTK